MPPTLDQKRAAHAFDKIQSVPKGALSDLKTETKRFPTRVINNGLGHALAFLQAKGKATPLLEALDDWTSNLFELQGHEHLVQYILYGDAQFLRRATDEVLAYLQWFVRFLEAAERENN